MAWWLASGGLGRQWTPSGEADRDSAQRDASEEPTRRLSLPLTANEIVACYSDLLLDGGMWRETLWLAALKPGNCQHRVMVAERPRTAR
jgi:hypothetical protein